MTEKHQDTQEDQVDIDLEAPEPSAATDEEATPVDDKDTEMEALQAENTELEERVLRLQAEMQNIQRRNTRERQDAAKYRSQKLATSLLEAIDNLERALLTEVSSEDGKSLLAGVEMVHGQILQIFAEESIAVIDPIGEAFDPNFHQAVSTMPAEEEQATNEVVQVLQKGYQLDDRVIRPAMVVVTD